MSFKRLFSAVNRHWLRRRLPHGLISWRYLVPFQAEVIHIHRRLWLLGRDPRLPLPFYLLQELLLWLRWVSWCGWRQSLRVLKRRGREIREREGIGLFSQFTQMVRLSVGRCIPPHEVCTFGLYRHGGARAAWEYVFVNEVQAFHRRRNAGREGLQDALALMQDKHALALLLTGRGIPAVSTLAVVPRGNHFDPQPFLEEVSRLFCKPRHGSTGRDSFVMERRHDGTVAIFHTQNGIREAEGNMEALQAALQLDDFLVQPFLHNHPALDNLSSGNDVVTVRVVTEYDNGTARCWSAVLEVPFSRDDVGGHGHCILPIDLATGKLRPFPVADLPLSAIKQHNSIFAEIGSATLPYWQEISSHAVAAHALVPGLFSIAWDFVVTPDGPVLLEGNSGWGLTVPQTLRGGLLRNSLKEH